MGLIPGGLRLKDEQGREEVDPYLGAPWGSGLRNWKRRMAWSLEVRVWRMKREAWPVQTYRLASVLEARWKE